MMTFKEYTDLIGYIHDHESKFGSLRIINVQMNYNLEKNKIWAVSFRGIDTNMTYIESNPNTMNCFVNDTCTVVDIKDWFNSYERGD